MRKSGESVDTAVDTAIQSALERLARNDSGRVLSLLAKRFGDLDLADEAVQEAMIEAAQRWSTEGVPDNPPGWLHQVARRKAIDRIRRRDSADRRLMSAAPDLVDHGESIADATPLVDDGGFDGADERLRLMLLCCHPSLDRDAQIALTLRLVGGLTTEEIAAAFLVPTPTLAQRISRAKKKIRTAGIPMSLPERLDDRLGAVTTVLYLTFNEGYLSRSAAGDPVRVDLCAEAIRLTEVVANLTPEHAEVHGLLGLLLFTHARRDARFAGGELAVLADQDRSLWHLDEIGAGNSALRAAMQLMSPGAFQMQAVIAAQHANAREAGDTDWPMIVKLYDQLLAMRPSPVVALNRAAAIGVADGPLHGLKALDGIDGLDSYHLFHATRAEFLRQIGRNEEAAESLALARECTANPAEQRLLTDRLAQLA